jgi:hypothetical protein
MKICVCHFGLEIINEIPARNPLFPRFDKGSYSEGGVDEVHDQRKSEIILFVYVIFKTF